MPESMKELRIEPWMKPELQELRKNPKIQKALRGILAPLKQSGDSLTISSGEESVKIDFEEAERINKP